MKMLNIENYPYESWVEKYQDYDVDVTKLPIDSSWRDLFDEEFKKDYFKRINKYLSHCLKITNGEVKIYPYPDLIFNAFNKTPLDKVKVVILGQDPYHQNEKHNGNIIPQAMGLSFSVPVGIKTPSSLVNIFKNQLKFNVIKECPNHGNLEFWAEQGVMLFNTTLTVQHGCPNGHLKYWNEFSNNVIKYISDKKENVVFILWGKPALEKLDLIDTSKHKVIISSHPSGQSCHSRLRQYKAFVDTNHFSEANEYLKKKKIKIINWQLKMTKPKLAEPVCEKETGC